MRKQSNLSKQVKGYYLDTHLHVRIDYTFVQFKKKLVVYLKKDTRDRPTTKIRSI